MKPWIKTLLGLGIIWAFIGNGILVWLVVTGPEKHMLLLIASSLASSIILMATWLFLTLYVARRSDLTVASRVLWAIGFFAGPIGLIVQPVFYFLHILKHPTDRPIFDPFRSAP